MPTPSYDTTEALPTPSFITASFTGYDPFFKPDSADAYNKRYFFFGDYENILVYNGSELLTASGIAPATLTATTVSTTPGITASKRLFTYTLYDSSEDVETGPYADLTTIDYYKSLKMQGDSALLSFAAVAAGSRFDQIRIYMSLADSADMRLWGTGTVSTAVWSVTVGGAVSEAVLGTRDRLSVLKRFYTDGLPPKSRTGMFFGGRLYIADGNIVRYSESEKTEDIPTKNKASISGSPRDLDPKIMALRDCNGQRVAYTKRGGYLVTGDSPPFGLKPLFTGVGASGTLSTISVEGVGVIFFAHDKPYLHVGGSDVRALGSAMEYPNQSPVEDLYLDYDAGMLEHAVAWVQEEESLVVLAIPTAGSPSNDRLLCWFFDRNQWVKDSGRFPSVGGRWSDLTGRERPVFGDDLGGVWQAEMGNAEGGYVTTMTGLVTASTRTTLTTSGLTTLGSAAYGLPVLVRDATTGLVKDRNRILSESGGVLTLAYAWTTLPSANDTVEVGCIEGIWESGWITVFRDKVQAVFKTMWIYFEKATAGTLRVLLGSDQISTLRSMTTTLPLTSVTQEMAFTEHGTQFKIRLEESAPGNDFAIEGFDVEVTKKDHRV